ncbi:MAG: immune inhibitor A [Bacteroidetes bacterium]|nr:immune inhibitor A [Bacteroidota bacterium]
MKRILLTLISLFALSFSYAQTTVFHEDFEVVDSVTSSGNPTWFQESLVQVSGSHCMRDTILLGDTAYLTSNTFSTIGFNSVQMDFWHICKISFADKGTIEVSNDNGVTWTQLTSTQYLSTSGFSTSNNFSSYAYGLSSSGWDPFNDLSIPDNTWWKHEVFDLSLLIPNSAQAKIRFEIFDGNSSGGDGNYGWVIDDINVIAAPHELIGPTIVWSPPVLSGNIYSLGPFSIKDTVTDASGVSSANLFYSINGGAFTQVAMSILSGSVWQGIIPTVNNGDTICYYVQATDIWGNSSVLPSAGTNCMYVSSGISFPYIENFDINTTLWTSSSTSGSSWQLGTPSFGATNSAHSNPNAWDIDLASGYLDNTYTTLTSPVFNFNNINNPILSFWRNHNCEGNWDGTRLEYTTDGGLTWQLLGIYNDPQGTNWYNYTNINSNPGPAWSGNSNGWIQSTYRLGCLFSSFISVQFRFLFTSDPSVNLDGFSIDDFSITLALPQDIGVTAILQPGGSAPAGTNDSVRVIIRNFGSQPATGFPVNYSINGGAPVSQFYAGTLQPCGAGDTISFTALYSVPAGAYSICAFTSMTGDGNASNDSTCKSSQGIPLVTLSYNDDFETPPSLWYDSSAAGTSWELGTPNFGVTNSAHTPVNAWDINLNSAYGNNARAILTSPIFNFNNVINPVLSFWRNHYCEGNWDGTKLEYTTDGGLTWQLLGVYNDPQGMNWYNYANINSNPGPAWSNNSNGWIQSSYRLGCLFSSFGNVQFRFVFTSDGSVTYDGFTIDDFSITLASPQDIGVTAFLQPAATALAGASNSVQVIIANFGSQPATGFTVNYSVNGGAPVSQLYSGTLQPCDIDTVLFTAPYFVPTGTYSICAFTTLAGDGNTSNDSICKNFQGIPLITLPYTDNFETPPSLWYDSSAAGTNWELGIPNFGATNSAHSPVSAWDINLNAGYGNNARSVLTSPFFDFTSQVNAKLSFWMNRNISTGDGAWIEYSIDTGLTWQRLGIVGDPDALNNYWYNNASINFTGLPGWDGNSNGWVKYTYILGVPFNNAGTGVQFRFIFYSNGFTTSDGISIDDIAITPASPIDLGVVSINQPFGTNASGASASVDVTIKNFGTSTVTNSDIAYKINGTLVATEPWTGSLTPSSTTTFTFSTQFTVPSGQYDLCAFTSLNADGDHINDTTCATRNGIPSLGAPYFDDFEGPIYFYSLSPTEWQYGVPSSSVIDSAYSPVNAWKTNLSGDYSANDDIYLYSPYFDFTGAYQPELRFWHWYDFEQTFDGGRVDISTDGGFTWNQLGSVGDTAATNWYTLQSLTSSGKPGWTGVSGGYIQSVYRLHSLQNWHGGLIQFRFNFSSDGSVNHNGWAIDNFEIYSPFPNAAPIAISPVFNPFYPTGAATEADSVLIKNQGSLEISSLDVSLSIDGTIMTTDNLVYSPPLAPGASNWHTFSSLWHPSLGGHQICAITSNPNATPDINPYDDTLCVYGGIFDSVTVTQSAPYCNDFENGNGYPGWIPLNAFSYVLYDSDWQLGTPAKTVLNSAHSGSKSWVTKLTGDYTARDSSGVFSPVFAVDTTTCYELSFWHKFDTENFQDGGTVEFSIDNGVSWHIVGFAYESNWFNSLYITGLVGGPPTPGWSGNTGGIWWNAKHNIRFTHPGHVIFRFRFGSDMTTQSEGWTFDDVCFQKIGACTIGINEIVGHSVSLDQNFPNPASDITYFTYSIPEHGKVKLYVTDVLGRTINILVNESQGEGLHAAQMNVKDLANGMYYYTLEFNDQKMVRKFVVAK